MSTNENTASVSALELWSLDELCDHAFGIFEELAEENLSEADYQHYLKHAEEFAFVDLVLPDAEWEELFAVNLDPELHVEACIGVSEVASQQEMVLARILLSKEKYETLCHARWRGQNV